MARRKASKYHRDTRTARGHGKSQAVVSVTASVVHVQGGREEAEFAVFL